MQSKERRSSPEPPLVAHRSGRAMQQFAIGTFLTALFCILLAGTALAQTNLTTLHQFLGVRGDGYSPIGDLTMDSQGSLYGVAKTQGYSIYQMTPPAINGGSWTKTTIYNGMSGIPVGAPIQPVILGKDGALYGTAQNCAGTPWWFGCVFRLSNSGGAWSMQVIHYFQGAAQGDGRTPVLGKLVTDANGNLYGVTGSGGLSDELSLAGTVYQLTPPAVPGGAWTETVLYKFNHGPGGFYNPKTALAIDQNGALYGATAYGVAPGKHGTQGVIYQLVPPPAPGGSWTIHVINNAIGGGYGSFVSQMTPAPSGALYGVSSFAGGAFELMPPLTSGGTWTVNLLPAKGAGEHGWELTRDANGVLYGINELNQTVYKMTPPATAGGVWTYSVLHTFIGGSEGSYPTGRLVVDSSGHLFGATSNGGTGACGGRLARRPGCGTVFELQ